MLRNFNVDIAVGIGTTYSGAAIPVDKAFDGFAVQAVISAASSPVGSLKVQASIDAAGSPTNWSDIPDTATAVSAAGSWIWNFSQTHFRWVRVVYTRTSGSATLDTTFNENR